MDAKQRSMKTKRLVTLAMMSTLAFAVMYVTRLIPSGFLFLRFDMKDVIIILTGFIFGPLSAAGVSVVVSAIEMVTVSDTAWIGFIMNVLSSIAFACPAAYLYKKRQKISGAVAGLILGGLLMTAVMLLWNWLITPMYMDLPREEVAAMLVPVFLPFNLIKAALVSAITLIIYKPVVTGLRKARLLPPSTGESAKGKLSAGVIIASAIVLASCVLLVLIKTGVL